MSHNQCEQMNRRPQVKFILFYYFFKSLPFIRFLQHVSDFPLTCYNYLRLLDCIGLLTIFPQLMFTKYVNFNELR